MDLASQVRSFLAEPLVVTPGDTHAEVLTNTIALDFDPAVLEVEAVALALVDVGAALKARFGAVTGPLTFYAWHDKQAGQLRCSMGSAAFDQLPFRGQFRPVTDPTALLASLAADANPGLVAWDELAEIGPVQKSDVDFSFPVFVVKVA